MSRQPLTKKEQMVLDYIREYKKLNNYAPTFREIGEAVGVKSSSTPHKYLRDLESKGYISKNPAKPRTIDILDEHENILNDESNIALPEMVNVPLVGEVAAGEPLLAQENIQDYFPVPVGYMPNSEMFMLKVKGDSMINIGIFEGDMVLVEKSSTARNGDLVVALVEDGATVKTYYKEDGYYRLQPENDDMEPIIVQELSIMGHVKGVFRFL